MDERELLQAYTKGRSEAAFTELVRLHLDWVYSIALRHVGHPHLAEDVVQSVFVLLARKAPGLRPGTLLGGWLFRTTRQVAANARRSDERRKNREATACSMNNDTDSPDPNEILWQQLVPHLDQAVAALSEADRSAVLLKFYERMPLRQIGEKLGVSEEAAKKRVSRGVERMREFLLRRGAKPGAALLAAVLAEKSVMSASAGLAGAVVNTSLSPASAPAMLPQLARETLLAWQWAKVKMVAGLAAVSLALIFLAVETDGLMARHPSPQVVVAKVPKKATGAYQVRGTIQRFNFALGAQEPNPLEAFNFGLLVDGAKWDLGLKSLRENPGPSSRVSCDGTNIYAFVAPIVARLYTGETLGAAASISPAMTKTFAGPSGPLWWLFCSPNALSGAEGPCLDFMSLLGPMSGRILFFQNGVGGDGTNGFPDRRVFLADPQGSNTPPLALLHVDRSEIIAGIPIPIQATLHRCRQTARNADGTPVELERWVIRCDSWESAQPLSSYVPDLSTNGLVMIQDDRPSHARMSYGTNFTPTTGRRAPAFKVKTTAGQTLKFPENYKGKVLLLTFWTTACEPCVAEMPDVEAVLSEYHQQSFEVLGVSLNRAGAEGKIAELERSLNITWPRVYDGKSLDGDIAVKYGVTAVPHAFLLDGDTGTMLAEWDGILRARLVPALKEALASKQAR
jgi:RNA polymerase sigma factor (sigma-70 family)